MRALLGVAVAATVFSACGGGTAGTICTQNDQVDLSAKAGACMVSVPAHYLGGTKDICLSAVKPCSDGDQKALGSALDCLAALPVCSADDTYGWALKKVACNKAIQGISPACASSVFGGVTPSDDAGFDAGIFDAGRQPARDGGGAVDLFAAGDETGVSFAWTVSQTGPVATWELDVFDPQGNDGGRLPEVTFGPGGRRTFDLSLDAGLTRTFFIAGLDADGGQVSGEAPMMTMMSDAGLECVRATDCAPEKVCSLGKCVVESCQPAGAVTCPATYQCLPDKTCHRQSSDGGMFDAGRPMPVDSGVFVPRPFLSELVGASTGMPGFSAAIPVGGYVSKRPDVVAFDTARALVAAEQEGLPVGHLSQRRGLDLVDDAVSASPIDTTGSKVHLAWDPASDLVYACYNVGRGVRVRRSTDHGRTWGTDAVDIAPVDDGGFSSSIQDCDIAAWKGGSALLVTIDDDSLVVRTVSQALSVGAPEVAFISGPADGGGGNLYQPRHPAIATLPADSIVHVGFTGSRVLGGLSDTEVYGVYRDSTTGTFLSPTLISNLFNPGAGGGNGLPQDYVSLTIDPKTKRGFAAYSSLVAGSGATSPSTAYVASFNPTNKTWIAGEPLSLTYKSPQSQYYLFPDRQPSDLVEIVSPSVAALPSGTLVVTFAAGVRSPGGDLDLRMYLAKFDFSAQVPQGTAKGWFVPPAQKMSEVRVLDPRSGSNVVPAPVSACSADSQRSVYTTFIEGVGQFGEIENRATVVTRP